MNIFKQHVELIVGIITILGAIFSSALWMNSKFSDVNDKFTIVNDKFSIIQKELSVIEKEIAVIKTVMFMKGLMPSELVISKVLENEDKS